MKTKKKQRNEKKIQPYESSCVTVIFWTSLWKESNLLSLGCSYLVHFGAASHVCRLHDESISSIEWVLELKKKTTKREKADVAKGKMMIFPGCGGAFHGRCLSRFRFPRRSRAASRTFGVLFGLGQPSLDSTIRMRSESRPDAIVVCSTTFMPVYTGSPLYTVPVLCLQKSTQNSTTVPALSFCFRINFLTTSFN